jgi:hypothetical protein
MPRGDFGEITRLVYKTYDCLSNYKEFYMPSTLNGKKDMLFYYILDFSKAFHIKILPNQSRVLIYGTYKDSDGIIIKECPLGVSTPATYNRLVTSDKEGHGRPKRSNLFEASAFTDYKLSVEEFPVVCFVRDTRVLETFAHDRVIPRPELYYKFTDIAKNLSFRRFFGFDLYFIKR